MYADEALGTGRRGQPDRDRARCWCPGGDRAQRGTERTIDLALAVLWSRPRSPDRIAEIVERLAGARRLIAAWRSSSAMSSPGHWRARSPPTARSFGYALDGDVVEQHVKAGTGRRHGRCRAAPPGADDADIANGTRRAFGPFARVFAAFSSTIFAYLLRRSRAARRLRSAADSPSSLASSAGPDRDRQPVHSRRPEDRRTSILVDSDNDLRSFIPARCWIAWARGRRRQQRSGATTLPVCRLCQSFGA